MKINEALKKYSLVPTRYLNDGNVSIIDTSKGKFVYKDGKIRENIYNYLRSRNFDYMPYLVSDVGEDFYLTKYEEGYDIPSEQKMLDLIKLTALLHNKTTHYKEVDLAYYEELYDDLSGNIDYLYSYYTDLIIYAETKVFMSPKEYLLARNITIIYDTLDLCKDMLDKWEELVKEKTRKRSSVLHNNLRLDHFIVNEKSFLISWDKAKVDSPVFDLYKLYKNHALDFDFGNLFNEYEKFYPLKDDEKLLLYILISLPDIVDLNGNEYDVCCNISSMVDSLYRTSLITKKV